jgi:hypothetical protein
MTTTARGTTRLPGMVLVLAGLAACAATGKPLSQDGVDKLAGYSIQAFLKERFVDAVRTIKIGEEKNVNADGSVLLEALYTDVNMAQLHRPSIELVRFCRAQGGRSSRTDVNRPAERAAAEALRKKADEERFCKEVAERREATELDCRASMTRARAYEWVPLQKISAAEHVQQGLPADDFGRFSCRHQDPAKHPDWDVVVEAVAFEPGQSGTLKANSLTLLISPEGK